MTASKSRTVYLCFIAFNIILSLGILLGRLTCS